MLFFHQRWTMASVTWEHDELPLLILLKQLLSIKLLLSYYDWNLLALKQ